ncbi:MAG TPA: metallophosphoesterase, partial [Agriterribacter sp.]|nr:metallophosphoesterase [Agriterribacter sp.]
MRFMVSLRTFLQRILKKPVATLANRFSSRPNRQKVHDALTRLYRQIRKRPGKKGKVIDLNTSPQKIIIFSDL